VTAVLLDAGPFEARRDGGEALYAGLRVRLDEGRMSLLEAPSGAGKSTLLRQVAGMVRAPGAERLLAGEPCPSTRLAAWRTRVTLLAQDAPMLPGSVEDNLRFPFALRSAGGREWPEGRTRELLAALLSDVPRERQVGTLSGGERHRLALIRGLLWDPPVLLADEPLSGLDPERAERCVQLLLEYAHRPGRAALVVLHEPGLANRADLRLRLRPSGLEQA
jgi:ABC-type iron transport system FetAB ATPase subunit